MPKEIEEIPLVSLKVDFDSEVPLYKQLYNTFRQSILDGKFSPGQKLPGTRSLARELNVSRNTVALAFEQLLIEGYIKGKTGSGTFVNEIPDNFLNVNGNKSGKKSKINFPNKLNNQLDTSEVIRRNTAHEAILPFQNGVPSLNDFPIKTWLKLNNQIVQTFSNIHLGYGDATGYKPLREEIAAYLCTYRAVNCTAEQIIIVNGSQQGLDLIGRVLLERGDNVWLEDPGYFGARGSMLFADSKIFPCPLDDEGLDIKYSSKKYPAPKLIYTTPSHQFPLGITTSAARRIELLQYASKNNSWIIEDDYDSEFRYYGDPLPSLQGMDKNNCVLYLGTFSKVLFPALRLGYLVLPDPQMADIFVSAKSMMDRQCPVFEQMIVTEFLKQGYFTRHIRKMRMLYKSRQEFLINEIENELNGILQINPSPAGMQIIGWLPKNINDKKVVEAAKKNRLVINPLSSYSIKFFKEPGLIIGYTAFNEKEIRSGIKKLKQVLERFGN